MPRVRMYNTIRTDVLEAKIAAAIYHGEPYAERILRELSSAVREDEVQRHLAAYRSFHEDSKL